VRRAAVVGSPPIPSGHPPSLLRRRRIRSSTCLATFAYARTICPGTYVRACLSLLSVKRQFGVARCVAAGRSIGSSVSLGRRVSKRFLPANAAADRSQRIHGLVAGRGKKKIKNLSCCFFFSLRETKDGRHNHLIRLVLFQSVGRVILEAQLLFGRRNGGLKIWPSQRAHGANPRCTTSGPGAGLSERNVGE
jgi:hypothetical protein